MTPVNATGNVETVYNFRVAEHHTYFVGGDDWGFSIWVHNRYSVKPIPGDFVNGNQVYGLWDDTLNNGAGGWANYPNTGQPIRSTSPGKLGDVADNANAKANAPTNLRPGSFSITDWSNYPSGVPKPSGPFRLLTGAEYDAARKAANQANDALRRADPAKYAGKQNSRDSAREVRGKSH